MVKEMLEYNQLVERYKKAEEYFEREDIPVEDKIGQADNIQALVHAMDLGHKKITDMGYVMTSEEMLEGFRQVKYLNERGWLRM